MSVALQAVEAARPILLAECARPDGPRGEIGHCPADDEAEWAIRDVLLRAFPTWGLLGEETGEKPAEAGQECVWFVDPNDGTTSMQRGYRGHAIAIGLVRRGTPVLGVVCAVDAPDDEGDLIAWAEGCGPIRRNGLPLPPRSWPDTLGPEDIVGLSQGAMRNPVGYLRCVMPARFVNSPSIAYRLALVAAGDHVATVSLNYLRAWDSAAGDALVRAAGGIVVDEHGREIVYPAHGPGTASRLFAGGPAIVKQLLQQDWDSAQGSGFGEAAPPPTLAPARAQPGRLVHASGVLARAQGCLLGQLSASDHGGAGQPTSGSELALALARSLVVRGTLDEESVAHAYAAWFHGWTHAEEPIACEHAWCRPTDVDATTAQALAAISAEDVRAGRAAERARAAASRQSEGNAALVRMSPLGIWGAFRSPAEVASAAREDARLTHSHPICQSVSAVFAVTLASVIREGLTPVETHTFALQFVNTTPAEPTVVEAINSASEAAPPPSDTDHHPADVLVALQNAFYQLLHAPDYPSAIHATLRQGGDTRTNAAICGALLGAVHARPAIPPHRQQLVLSCRPLPHHPAFTHPRPALDWPTDTLILTERLLMS